VLKIYAKYYVQCIEFLNDGYATVSLLLESIISFHIANSIMMIYRSYLKLMKLTN